MYGADKGSAIAMWRNEIGSATLHRDCGIARRRNTKEDVECERWSKQPWQVAIETPRQLPRPWTRRVDDYWSGECASSRLHAGDARSFTPELAYFYVVQHRRPTRRRPTQKFGMQTLGADNLAIVPKCASFEAFTSRGGKSFDRFGNSKKPTTRKVGISAEKIIERKRGAKDGRSSQSFAI